MNSTVSTTNLFDELGATDAQTILPPELEAEGRRQQAKVPASQAGAKTSDLCLRSTEMRLVYKDERVNDPAVRQWMQDRQLGVGASEIAVLFGLSPWQSLRELWYEKVHGCSFDSGSELFHFGHEMEPLIAAEFERRTGEQVAQPAEMISVGSRPHHRASLDRVVLEDGKPAAALELKNLHEGRYAEYRASGPSTGYLLQLQYQMAVSQLDVGYLACLFGGQKWACWRVMASPSVQREILRRVDEFWSYVESKTEPPENLGGRAVVDADQTLVLDDPVWETRFSVLEDIRVQKSKLDKEEKAIKQEVKEVMGDATSARAGEFKASLSVSSRKSLDTARLKKEQEQLVQQYTKDAEVKILRISRIK